MVNFYECFQIPAVAWQKLRGAKWPKLKKAYFNSYLAETEMVEGVCVFFGQYSICLFWNISPSYTPFHGLFSPPRIGVPGICQDGD